ncbi:MAG: ABC transporter ATP-binding protein [Hyphomicrobiaceae bacterium]|nr:ABC transporter ATP-binding protein [Hyphomicrobiaceae bacterium]MCC0022738.1 ABC transporter ATP-binding protein [Hyphomicrobiaceae bacterium]
MNAAAPILSIKDLSTWFDTRAGIAKAVDGVSFELNAGETLCVVGESGCGKSITALSIMGLIPRPGRVVNGQILFKDLDLLALKEREFAKVRGNRISMIFQDPSSSLNPVHTVGDQIAEVFTLHMGMSDNQAHKAALDVMKAVGIPDPETRMKAYPHEMSGGMAQRIMIAMALACEPEVLIADEPTTALDVTIQAQILDLMRELQEKSATATILITHDLGIVAEMADKVAVMYAGQVVEFADVMSLFENPQHPYTKALMRSIPVIGAEQELLEVIEGRVPPLTNLPQGCRFAPRCAERKETPDPRCETTPPELVDIGGGHTCRCWLRNGQ